MTSWRIYYDDGSSFDSTMGSQEEAPSFGIICIVQPDEDLGRLIMNGWDWYYFHDGEKQWWGADVHGLLDQLLHNAPIRAIKQGRNAPNKVYHSIMQVAMDDPDFPVKGGRSKRERPFQVA